MSQSRQTLAWSILIASFFVCMLTAVAVPVGYATYRQRAKRPISVVIQRNQGTLLAENGDTRLIDATNPRYAIEAPVTVRSDSATDSGTVQLLDPVDGRLLARLQLFGNSDLDFITARTPRFAASNATAEMLLNQTGGRVRVTVPQDSGRQSVLQIATVHGFVLLDTPGQYIVEVSNVQTQLSVLNGAGQISNDSGAMILTDGERGVARLDIAPSGPFDTARNLIENGDFRQDFSGWVPEPPLTWNRELSDQPDGKAEIVNVNGEPALRFERVGIGHIDGSLRQIINEDLTGYDQMFLLVSLRVTEQSLPVCGSLGTECPLTIRLDFIDADGRQIAWQQGLYAVGEPSSTAPNYCVVCGPPLGLSQHQPINAGQVAFYESDNLQARLNQEGLQPVELSSITLIAAGHTFAYDVLDVSLLVSTAGAVEE